MEKNNPSEKKYEILTDKQNDLLQVFAKKKIKKHRIEKRIKELEDKLKNQSISETKRREINEELDQLSDEYEDYKYLYFDNSQRQTLFQIREKVKKESQKIPEIQDLKDLLSFLEDL
jgi:transcriptional regulator NrdR family protein